MRKQTLNPAAAPTSVYMSLSCHFMKNVSDIETEFNQAIAASRKDYETFRDAADFYKTREPKTYANYRKAAAKSLQRARELQKDLKHTQSVIGKEYAADPVPVAVLESNLKILETLNDGKQNGEVWGHICQNRRMLGYQTA